MCGNSQHSVKLHHDELQAHIMVWTSADVCPSVTIIVRKSSNDGRSSATDEIGKILKRRRRNNMCVVTVSHQCVGRHHRLVILILCTHDTASIYEFASSCVWLRFVVLCMCLIPWCELVWSETNTYWRKWWWLWKWCRIKLDMFHPIYVFNLF